MIPAVRDSGLLVTLLASDLVASTSVVSRLGDERVAELFARHDRMARDLQAAYGAREIDKTDGFLLTFDRTTSAVLFALDYHEKLAAFGAASGVTLEARIGIHVGEVIFRENPPGDVARGAKPIEVEGLAKPVVARIMSLAGARQTLLTRGAFDLARRGTMRMSGDVAWLAHGSYVVAGIGEAIDIYEVGHPRVAPLAPPADTEKARRVIDPDTIVGWRPAPGVEVPGRPNWELQEKIGVGGFGDVWRAEHKKTHESRVYKFCYDARRLTGLKREVTLVRLLKVELGERKDIARVIDWNFDDVPYFLESEWNPGGSLEQWIAAEGGASAVPLVTRIELVAQVADALAAAHSVGVLHKDIKPANILIREDADGTPHACLTDFGIGLLTDRGRLAQAGITASGFTEIHDPDIADTSLNGTRLYMAPEATEGKPPTVQADVYALGVMLYELAIGDLSRALGSGWEADVPDELIRDDIASAVDVHPERRIDVRMLAHNLRSLEARRADRAAAARALADARRAKKRRSMLVLAGAALLLVTAATVVQLGRVRAEANRANREAETSRRVSDFMVELFRLADPGEARGNTVTAREILDQGARRIESGLADEPTVRAALMATMGQVYLGLGLGAAARPLADQSLQIRRREFGERSAEVAESMTLLGEVDYRAGAFDSAAKRYAEAASIASQRVGTPSVAVADAMVGWAASLWQSGHYAAADSIGRAAIAMYRRVGSPPAKLAVALSAVGSVLFSTNRSKDAEPMYREALELTRAIKGPEDRQVAMMMTNLGMVLTAEGRLDEARPVAQDALALYRKLLGSNHPTTALSMAALGFILSQQHSYAESETLLRESLAVFRAQNPQNDFLEATVEANLAGALADDGKCAESELLSREAIGAYTKRLPAGNWQTAQAQSILGACLARDGRSREAEPLLTSSYETLQRTQGGIWERAALERLITYYERAGNQTKAAEYRVLRTRTR
jgi:class 3 adenylate cyclase/tetratricopeptide (TPR) repeat protein